MLVPIKPGEPGYSNFTSWGNWRDDGTGPNPVAAAAAAARAAQQVKDDATAKAYNDAFAAKMAADLSAPKVVSPFADFVLPSNFAALTAAAGDAYRSLVANTKATGQGVFSGPMGITTINPIAGLTPFTLGPLAPNKPQAQLSEAEKLIAQFKGDHPGRYGDAPLVLEPQNAEDLKEKYDLEHLKNGPDRGFFTVGYSFGGGFLGVGNAGQLVPWFRGVLSPEKTKGTWLDDVASVVTAPAKWIGDTGAAKVVSQAAAHTGDMAELGIGVILTPFGIGIPIAVDAIKRIGGDLAKDDVATKADEATRAKYFANADAGKIPLVHNVASPVSPTAPAKSPTLASKGSMLTSSTAAEPWPWYFFPDELKARWHE